MARPLMTWERHDEWDDYDYHTYGSPVPSWDVADEEWRALDDRERHYDFIYRTPDRVSDDWLEEAA